MPIKSLDNFTKDWIIEAKVCEITDEHKNTKELTKILIIELVDS